MTNQLIEKYLRMNIETRYYTGYEEDGEESEEELNESSEEENDEKFKEYLKTKSKTKKSIKKSNELSKKDLANEFENEMNKELDDMIDKEHQTYLKKLDEFRIKSDIEPSSQKVDEPTPQYEEEEDTDSEAELETGVRTTKKRAHFTNDELFYDPNLDEEDESWMNKQRKTCKKIISPLKREQIPKSILKPSSIDSTAPSTSQQTDVKITYTDAKTDAILNCPCCMTMLTMDCQRHEQYKTQYRAMFVFNCKIKQDEILKYPLNLDLESNVNNHSNKKKKRNKNNKFEKIKQSGEDEMAVDSKQNETQQFDLYKPVVCEICNVEVGVYDDKDELYHFFNVLASHS